MLTVQKLPQITQAVFAAAILVLLTFCTESPRILVKKGKNKEAKSALQKLRSLGANDLDLVLELRGIEAQVASEKETANIGFFKSFWTLFTRSQNLDRLTLTCTAHLLQVWSGASSITVYAPEYFKILGVTDENERLLYTAVVGIVKLAAAAACALFAVDQFGRRRSLSCGITVQLLCITYIAAVLSVLPGLSKGKDTGKTESVGISAIVFMYLCGAGYAFGWNSASYIITVELFSLQTRTIGTAIVMTVHYGSRYGLQKAVPLMTLSQGLGPAGTFWFFSGVTLVGLIWVWAWLPETGSMQLEKAALQIHKGASDDPWGDDSPQEGAKKFGKIKPQRSEANCDQIEMGAGRNVKGGKDGGIRQTREM